MGGSQLLTEADLDGIGMKVLHKRRLMDAVKAQLLSPLRGAPSVAAAAVSDGGARAAFASDSPGSSPDGPSAAAVVAGDEPAPRVHQHRHHHHRRHHHRREAARRAQSVPRRATAGEGSGAGSGENGGRDARGGTAESVVVLSDTERASSGQGGGRTRARGGGGGAEGGGGTGRGFGAPVRRRADASGGGGSVGGGSDAGSAASLEMTGGWVQHATADGYAYYHHASSGRTQWELPRGAVPVASVAEAAKRVTAVLAERSYARSERGGGAHERALALDDEQRRWRAAWSEARAVRALPLQVRGRLTGVCVWGGGRSCARAAGGEAWASEGAPQGAAAARASGPCGDWGHDGAQWQTDGDGGCAPGAAAGGEL